MDPIQQSVATVEGSSTIPPRLAAAGLAKSYGAVQALKGVDVYVEAGEILALCGENGAGKSTVVKILSGAVSPDVGTIEVGGATVDLRSPQAAQAAGIAVVDQELSLAPALSVLDNIWLGHRDVPLLHRRRALRARAAELLRTLSLDHVGLDTPVRELAIGERQLVEIARLLARDARLLILDEPTATLSDSEIERTFRALRALPAEGRSVIFVTHRLGEVFELCDRVTVLRNGTLAGSRRVDEIDRAQLVELMLGRPLDDAYPHADAVGGGTALAVRGLHIPDRVEALDLDVRCGEVVGLAGQLGSSAGHVLRALAGLVPGSRGDVEVAGETLRAGAGVRRALEAGLLYVSDDRAQEGVFLERRVMENLAVVRLPRLVRAGVVRRRAVRELARALAQRVGFDAARLDARVDQLSGGNQQKVALGRYLDRAGSSVLLLHEPTRGVDVGARAEIYATVKELCGAGCAVLMTSTDLEELMGVCDRIYTMYRGRIVGEFGRETFDAHAILADITAAKEAAA